LQILDTNQNVELAFAVLAITKSVRNFLQTHRAVAGRQQIDQNLEADSRNAMHHFHQKWPGQDEKSTHWIVDFATAHGLTEAAAEHAETNAMLRELSHTPAADIAAAHHDVEIFRLQPLEHFGEQRLIVLEVGIHHRHIGRGTG